MTEDEVPSVKSQETNTFCYKCLNAVINDVLLPLNWRRCVQNVSSRIDTVSKAVFFRQEFNTWKALYNDHTFYASRKSSVIISSSGECFVTVSVSPLYRRMVFDRQQSLHRAGFSKGCRGTCDPNFLMDCTLGRILGTLSYTQTTCSRYSR